MIAPTPEVITALEGMTGMDISGPIVHAVIQWTDSAFMDWPEFPGADIAESPGDGAVFLLDPDGTQRDFRRLHGPGVPGADLTLELMGWSRVGDWRTDLFGRPTTVVEPSVLRESRRPAALVPAQQAVRAWSESAALPV